jgi:hypothetical protein
MKFKLRYYLLAFLFACLAFLFTIAQKHLVGTVLIRSVLLFVVFSLLAFFFFSVVKSEKNTYAASKKPALFWSALAALVILTEHVIITFDISYKVVIILAASLAAPFLGGYLCNLIGSRSVDGSYEQRKTNG